MLVLRALGIGDLLVAVPALRGLRRVSDRLVLAAPAWLAPLVDLTGCVDTLLPTAGLGALRYRDPGVAVNLHGAGPESIADLLATLPTRLITHRHPAFPAVPGPEWVEEQHEVHRWCRLLAWHDIPADPGELDLALPHVASVAPGAVVVHPGASVAQRRWDADGFAAVARELAAAHRVVITGSAAERDLAVTVATGAGLPESSVLAGEIDLAELAALVADAALVVTNDTGTGHLATAYGTPSVVLFGATPPRRWGPPADRPRHAVLRTGSLTVADVLAAAHRVLSVRL
ncbi:glycosyltransferase family 9 protein [Actinophytocola algeriensis]|uniref:ADP-heptose:LPS heptosyltransferase n=1 Tax=Actinophytocola algeriensis TaxID=1768010 RepID=A0A7W7VGG8_9PSEU|nr:ADP-heptose:LPS heptosyltransferase [Actinophytocola algeriensis]MBE1474463.1 ADP-heptose:LPS heptosyltransferase [Actinophytocola algeriensis]